jgi:epoxyqueuosine reductase
MPLGDELIELGLNHGAAAVGICDVSAFAPDRMALQFNRASGRSGPLHFTYDRPEVASDVTLTFPWARSLVVLAVDYLARSASPAPVGAVVARFATADHYRLLDPAIAAITGRLAEAGRRAEPLVDDIRLLDRAAALRSGLGWRGRSTMVLAPGRGPWTLFGSVVTDALLPTTTPMERDCGRCVACLPACPTGAIDADGVDARRCLSTWLQTGGSIPHWIRPRLGRRIYGCDDCLTVCPPGTRALQITSSPMMEHRFEDLLLVPDDGLLNRFPWWYVPHRDPRIIRRNVLVAAGNSGEANAVPPITRYLGHRSALLRGHAAWALARALGHRAVATLEDHLGVETEPMAREEILIALQMIEEPTRHEDFLARESGGYPAPVSKREPVTAAVRAMRAAGIVYQPFLYDYNRHPGALGAAEAIGVDPHLTVKTIVMETSEGEGVIVLMNGDREISTKTLARLLGAKTTRPASPQRGGRWTGYQFGGTSPFGTREKLRIFATREIAAMEEIYVNAGSRGFVVRMIASDLIAALSPQLADLAV